MRLGVCKHFNGILEKTCRMGIEYPDVDDRPFKTWPCNQISGGNCPKADFPTKEEVQREDDEIETYISRALKIARQIPPGPSGTLDCQICGKKIQWSRSPRNNHLHAKCETDGCFQIMQ